METSLIVVLSFAAGALADHFLESKIRARVGDVQTAVKAEIATVKADVAAVKADITPKPPTA